MNRRFPRFAIGLAAVPCLLAASAASASPDSPYFRFGLGTGGPANVDLPVPPPSLPQAFPISVSGFTPGIEPGRPATGTFSSGVPSVSYTASGLPPGVTLSGDGILSGQSSVPGKYTATVTATDRIGRQSAVTLDFVVMPAAPTAVPANDVSSTLIAGLPFSATPATAGAPLTSWTMTSGPSVWLSVDPATGRVHGVPPQGTTRFSYATVGTDEYGRTVRVSDTVTLAQPYMSRVFPASAIAGDVVTGYVSSNLPAPTFSASPLPAWLSLDPTTGKLTGTVPAVAGTFRFIASAVQGSAGATYDITLGVPGVTLTSTLPAMVSKGLTTTGTLKASAGTGWAWSVLNAPSWLAVDPVNGNLTATPAQSDTSVSGLAWQATRNGVSVVSDPFAIQLVDPTVTLSPPPPSTLVEGDEVRITPTSNIPGATFSMSGAPTGSYIYQNGGALDLSTADHTSDRTYSVTVTAKAGTLTGRTTFPLTVKAATASLEDGTVRLNKDFSLPLSTTMVATGGWAVTSNSGGVTAGTSKDRDGNLVVAGRSTSVGTFTVTAAYTSTSTRAKATVSAKLTVLGALTLSSQPTDQLFIVQTAKAVQGPGVYNRMSGISVSYALLKDGAPFAPSDLASACPGLEFSTADGGIAGTPTATCSLTGLSYRVSDDGAGVAGAAATVDSAGTFRISVEPNELYGFTSQTFSTCGKIGRLGPALGDCTTAYSKSAWTSNSLYFGVDPNGKQVWTVPATGTYAFVVQGASGGGSPGKAAVVTGSFPLTAGDRITMVVGQVGTGYGGGGASAIFNGSTPLLVAGGSAGGVGGSNASLTTIGGSTGIHQWGCPSGSAAGGTNGYGGGGSCDAGGGGILGAGGNGGNSSNNPLGGDAIGPSGTAVGGLKRNVAANDGGFGGGGGAGFSGTQGGGGGGYSGGAGSGWTPNDFRPGGGGGSYASPTASDASIALAGATGSGYVTVSRQ